MTPSTHAAHSARLHAATAALCALLLLVALCLMDANHAPWWALLGIQGMLLVSVASAAIWLDRSVAFGVRRSAFGGAAPPETTASRAGQTPNAKRRTPLTVRGTVRYSLPGIDPEERVFWQERATAEEKDDVVWPERVRRGNNEEDR